MKTKEEESLCIGYMVYSSTRVAQRELSRITSIPVPHCILQKYGSINYHRDHTDELRFTKNTRRRTWCGHYNMIILCVGHSVQQVQYNIIL